MAKDRVTQLAAQVREAAHLHDPVARAVIELVKLSLEDVKERLVMEQGEDMVRTQGIGRYLTKLHKELTTVPPNIVRQVAQEQ